MTTPEPATGTTTDPAAQQGSPDQSTDTGGDQQPQPDTTPRPDDVETWKAHARRWERTAKSNKDNLDKANTELEELRRAQQSEQDKAITDARKAGADEATARWRSAFESERVHTEALALLAGAVQNPRLLLPHLDTSAVTVADDGAVDSEALKSAVDGLIEDFPDQKLSASAQPPTSPSWDTGPKPRAPHGSPKPTTGTGAELYRQRHGGSAQRS